ncbi:N-acetylmuramoyl-L-alanine amidase [Anaerobacillus sp. MEB173]|uniref:N-acetylmuramoyl-L-alanine amidase n=1 Tax=Anaerobacillus sp. MEB173 TaxID=3383345 RepID=UPI003F8E37D3
MNSFVISSGHGKYVRGAVGYIDEVTEARRITDKVAQYLNQLGCTVHKFHDDTSRNVRDNINTIVRYHNSKQRDLDISIHFNAGTKEIGGVEVLYLSDGNRSISAKVSAAISEAIGIRDRGAKKRTDLGFLNNTNKPAILIEVCFVDTKSNTDAYQKYFNECCIAIAEAVTGKQLKKGVVNVSTNQTVSSWAETAHKWVVDNKISDGLRPKDTVTREEMWTMLYRLAQMK